MDSGIAALFGALVGGGATVAVNYVQIRSNAAQQRIKTATELAQKEHGFDILLREDGAKRNYSLLSQYVLYYDAILRGLGKGQSISVSQLDELAKTYQIEPE
jgi:hypothetical protein